MNGTESERNERSDAVARPPELSFALLSLGEIDTTLCDWSSEEIQKQLPTEILLITANDYEFTASYSYMKNVKRIHTDSLGKVDFGHFDDNIVRVALILCEQGPLSAALTAKNAAEILRPKAIVFVGICATMKPEKAKLGDVVVSAKLATYADKKVREDDTVEYRGAKEKVSRNMGKLILSAAQGWQPPLKDPTSLSVQVHRDAVMLSGPELVNNLERRQELANYFQDAIGLEMEGAGLCAVARDLGIECVVIKAVSDFADGSKAATEEWQPFASVMAVSVVHNMFKYPAFKNWPHYKDKELLGADGLPDGLKSCTDGGSVARTMCGKCGMNGVRPLPDDRNNWPIYKMEIGYLEEICKLLDLEERSAESLMVALGCFSTNEAALIKKECMPNGCGIAKIALHRWGASKKEHDVGALKKILEETMKRVDVVEVIGDWENIRVCYGCGVKF